MESVAGVLLAAGGSTRLGRPKQLLAYRGQTLVRQAAETALAGGLDPLVVVLGAHAPLVRREVADLPVAIVENPAYLEGQSTSLRAGLAALPAETPAVMVLLADMPAVTADVIRDLANTWRATRAAIVRPTYAGQPGNPVLFTGALLPELAAVRGDEGGRAVLRAHAAAVQLLPVGCAGVVSDVDTWAAYWALVDGDTANVPAGGASRR